jgi:LacI family transcriptional regulator
VHAADVDDPVLPRLVADGTPLVQIGRHPYFQNLNWVSVANRDGACAIVDHLLALGHRRVATIAGPLQEAAAVDRRDGYKQALLQAGLPLQGELMTEGDWTEHSGHRAMTRLLGLDQRPTALFSANDMMAVGALRAIHEAGLAVPDDIALVGFDDLPVAAFTSPPLTTVRQPVHELGHAAAELLLDRLDGQTPEPTQLNLPLTLVIRDSCGAGHRTTQRSGAAPVQSDGRVARAHAHSPSAEDLGRAAEATP